MEHDIEKYPDGCRKHIQYLSEMLCTDYETAYAMMLMTALLTDLHPEDEEVYRMILKDCGMGAYA